jgi:hypothetical protein
VGSNYSSGGRKLAHMDANSEVSAQFCHEWLRIKRNQKRYFLWSTLINFRHLPFVENTNFRFLSYCGKLREIIKDVKFKRRETTAKDIIDLVEEVEARNEAEFRARCSSQFARRSSQSARRSPFSPSCSSQCARPLWPSQSRSSNEELL